jgi:RNA polymerase sigma-70 factor (ECF subfamily)
MLVRDDLEERVTESLLRWYFAGEPPQEPNSVPDAGGAQLPAVSSPTASDPGAVMPLAGEEQELDMARRIRDGDPAAFNALMRLHFTSLVRFAAGILYAREAAEDVVQTVFERLWRQRGRMPTTGTIRAFLFASVRNEALNAHKHNQVERRVLDTVRLNIPAMSESGIPEAELEDRHALLGRIHAIVATLPERQRSALALRYGQGQRIADVAEVLGISAKAAGQLLVRGIRTLRNALNSEEDAAG